MAVEDQEQAQVVVVQAGAGREPTQEILARLDGVSVGRITTREPTLEDAYVALVTQPGERRRPLSEGLQTAYVRAPVH